ncbi:MAG TPA: hypothetical protein VKK79_21625 [Candidatus Lokiarchaeia archaeon]|nr:hypothetical protein [Candidatus Lokiarchaeia archaeon]
MIWQIPLDETVREVALGLYVILVVIETRMAVNFLNSYAKNRELGFIGSIGLMYLFVAAGRVMLIIFDFYLTDFTYALYGDYLTYYKIAIGMYAAGLGFLIYVAERAIFQGRDKYVFLIGYAFFNILSMVPPDVDTITIFVTIGDLFILFVPISYIYTAIKTKGPFRTQANYIWVGIAFFAAGAFVIGEGPMNILQGILGTRYAVHIISVIFKMVGVVLIYRGFSYNIPKG